VIQEILQRMRDSLTLSDPEWDCSVGTPEYKILEAVAAELAAVYQGSLLNDYHFDIDTKANIELDRFVELFGVHRLQAKRATGTVTMSRGTVATEDHDIPAGTQVIKSATSISPAIYFQTVTAATLETGQNQVEIPIEAVVAGSSGNVVAGAVSLFAQAGIQGVTSVVNQNPVSGGSDPETDSILRQRWKATVFRNISGTEDQFLAVALDDVRVSRATVVGPVERTVEQLEITGQQVTAQVLDAKFVYPAGGEFFGTDLGSATETMATRFTHYDYFADNAPQVLPASPGTVSPPWIQILDSASYPDGTIVDFEYEYTPLASRNDPVNGTVYRIDVFIAGQDARQVFEEIRMDTTVLFSGTPGHFMDREQWRREDEVTRPEVNNYFMGVMNSPIVEIPSTILVGATTYTRDVHYWKIRDVTTNRGSTRARDGIEWSSAVDAAPANGTVLVLDYTFNELIRSVDERIKAIRLVGTDTLVHEAKAVPLRFHLSVNFGAAYSPAAETENIATAITAWLALKNFRTDVQVADLIDVVKNVISVDNVRLTLASEVGTDSHDIQRIAEDGQTVLATYPSTDHPHSDIYLYSDEIPVLESVVVVTRGQNTF
jgi:hypothetical protein